MPCHSKASLDALPNEILDEIFELVCSDGVSLSMLRLSRSIAARLRNHDIVRTLEAVSQTETSTWTCVTFDRNPLTRSPQTCPLDRHPFLARASFTIEYLLRFELAAVIKIFQERWFPLLRRDGCQNVGLHTVNLWKNLTNMMNGSGDGQDSDTEVQWCMQCGRTMWNWTQATVWPLEGIVVVRDRLLDRYWKVNIPLIRETALKSARWTRRLSS